MDIDDKVIPFELHPTGFIEAFCHFGADINKLLKDTGLHTGMIGSAGLKISYRQQTKLINNGITLCKQPGLGLLVGLYMDWSYNGSAGEIVNCSPSLHLAGESMRRYLTIAQPYYAMFAIEPSAYADKNDTMVIPLRFFFNLESDIKDPLFEIEYRLAVTLRIFDLCGNKSIKNNAVDLALDYPQPNYYNLYNQLPCTNIEFNCKHSYISCHQDFIIVPWREIRRASYNRVISICEMELNKANIETSFTEKVRWHISRNFNNPLTLTQVANILSVSPRSLTRKLANEGTNFRDIVYGVRMKLASFHLSSSQLNTEEIAELLGFSSGASLRRAIKNWSGKTLTNWRSHKTDN